MKTSVPWLMLHGIIHQLSGGPRKGRRGWVFLRWHAGWLMPLPSICHQARPFHTGANSSLSSIVPACCGSYRGRQRQPTLFQWIPTITLRGRFHHFPHLVSKEAETWRSGRSKPHPVGARATTQILVFRPQSTNPHPDFMKLIS